LLRVGRLEEFLAVEAYKDWSACRLRIYGSLRCIAFNCIENNNELQWLAIAVWSTLLTQYRLHLTTDWSAVQSPPSRLYLLGRRVEARVDTDSARRYMLAQYMRLSVRLSVTRRHLTKTAINVGSHK